MALPNGLRRTPPAVFPPVLGLLGLGIGWRRAAEVFDLPHGLPEAFLGAVTLLAAAAIFAYGVKVALRPTAVLDDLRTLPGRAGLATMSMSVMLAAAALLPHARGLALGVLLTGLGLHLLVALGSARAIWQTPPEGRGFTPAMHVTFVGFIVGPIAGIPLGLRPLCDVIFWYSLVAALVIWAGSLGQLLAARAPAPLRPVQAIHLAPAALLGMVAHGLGMETLALGFGAVATALWLFLVARARWLLEAGFSPFWGSLTFPMAAHAGLMLILAAHGVPGARVLGGVSLVLATLVILPVAVRILRLWLNGQLATRTNAATA